MPLPPCRDALDQVVERTLALVHFLKAQGATATHNMDNLLLRESMDVIGAHAFQTLDPPCMCRMQKENQSGTIGEESVGDDWGNPWYTSPCSCQSILHQ